MFSFLRHSLALLVLKNRSITIVNCFWNSRGSSWSLRHVSSFSKSLFLVKSSNSLSTVFPTNRKDTLHSVDLPMSETIPYLSAKDAYDLDVELMTLPGFTLEQLMELAGLAVAQVVYEVITPTITSSSSDTDIKVPSKILLICGPGNNGGDGLVAARHLVQFGHDAVVVYPKRPTTPNHYTNLVQTCLDMDIPVLYDIPDDLSSFDLIVDAIFGFSFRGDAPREPFASILTRMIGKDDDDDEQPSKKVTIPIVSVDIPSGWDVDQGDIHGTGLLPDVLISLTAPKLCARTFQGRRHFLAGRFLPPSLAKKYNLTNLPRYPGMSQFVEITNTTDVEETCNSN